MGCGGNSTINSSHMLGAFYAMERVMSKDFSPVRRVFAYAQEHFLSDIPILFVLTVTTNVGDDALKIYDIEKLKDGFNTLASGEEIFYISNPALGLWAKRDRMQEGVTDIYGKAYRFTYTFSSL